MKASRAGSSGVWTGATSATRLTLEPPWFNRLWDGLFVTMTRKCRKYARLFKQGIVINRHGTIIRIDFQMTPGTRGLSATAELLVSIFLVNIFNLKDHNLF